MDLQDLKEKLENTKDEYTRAQERLKVLKEQEKELMGELKDLGITDIDEIEPKIKELEQELHSLFNDIENVETEVLLEDDEVREIHGDLLDELGLE